MSESLSPKQALIQNLKDVYADRKAWVMALGQQHEVEASSVPLYQEALDTMRRISIALCGGDEGLRQFCFDERDRLYDEALDSLSQVFQRDRYVKLSDYTERGKFKTQRRIDWRLLGADLSQADNRLNKANNWARFGREQISSEISSQIDSMAYQYPVKMPTGLVDRVANRIIAFKSFTAHAVRRVISSSNRS